MDSPRIPVQFKAENDYDFGMVSMDGFVPPDQPDDPLIRDFLRIHEGFRCEEDFDPESPRGYLKLLTEGQKKRLETHGIFGAVDFHLRSLQRRKQFSLPVFWDNMLSQYKVRCDGLTALLHLMPEFLAEYNPEFYYSEYIQAAYDVAIEQGFLNDQGLTELAECWRCTHPDWIALCNAYFKRLGQVVQGPEFRKKVTESEEQEFRIKFRLDCLLMHLLAKYRKVCACRIDLYLPLDGYRPHPLKSRLLADGTMLDYAQNSFDRFINGLRQVARLKDVLIGHAWRLQFGKDRGYHYHLVLFLDGNYAQRHWFYANLSGEYWMRVAGQGSSFNNCSNDPSRYRRFCMGVVRLGEDDRIQALRHALWYFGEHKQLLSVRSGSACRTFSTSRLQRVDMNRVISLREAFWGGCPDEVRINSTGDPASPVTSTVTVPYWYGNPDDLMKKALPEIRRATAERWQRLREKAKQPAALNAEIAAKETGMGFASEFPF